MSRIDDEMNREVGFAGMESTSSSSKEEGSGFERTSSSMAGSVRGTSEADHELIDLVRDTVVYALRATGVVTTEAIKVTGEIINGALSAGEKVGVGVFQSAGSLTRAAVAGALDMVGVVGVSAAGATRSIVMGLIQGTKQKTDAAMHRWASEPASGSTESSTSSGSSSAPEAGELTEPEESLWPSKPVPETAFDWSAVPAAELSSTHRTPVEQGELETSAQAYSEDSSAGKATDTSAEEYYAKPRPWIVRGY